MAKSRKTSQQTIDVADSYAVRLMQHLVVPTFVIDRKYAVQGAQEAAVLRSALEEIARREAVDTPQ